MKNIFAVALLLGLGISSILAIECYRDEGEGSGEPEDCPTTVTAVDKVHDGLSTAWNWVKGAVDTAGSAFGKEGGIVNGWGDVIKEKVGIDLNKAGQTRAWTKNALKSIGADFDISNNCYVRYEKSTDSAKERACGAAGLVGDHAAKIVSWFQGNEYGGNCFNVPGNKGEEVCFCNTDNCNKSPASAKRAMGIDPNAKVIQCQNMDGNMEDCPVKNMKEQHIEFNNACYKLTENGETSSQGCFTKGGLFEYAKMPEAEALTSSKRKISQGTKTLEISELSGSNGSSRHYVKAFVVVFMITIAYFI